MNAREEKGEVGCAFVKAEAADHALFGESLQEPEDGRFIALLGEVAAGIELGQGHRAVVVREAGEDGFESLGATQTAGFGFVK